MISKISFFDNPDKVTENEIKEKIKDVTKALKMVTPAHPYNDYALMTLLCRVGELELCLKFNKRLDQKGKAKLTKNRLCKCYKDSGNQYE